LSNAIKRKDFSSTYTWTITDESFAKLQAAVAALPETGRVATPTYAPVMVLGSLRILAGIGLALLRRRSLISWTTAEMSEVHWSGPASPTVFHAGGAQDIVVAVRGRLDTSPALRMKVVGSSAA
jgi:hypothetical protein